MSRRRYWEVNNSTAFIIEGEIKTYLAYIDLKKIEWESPDEITVILTGYLPVASYLTTMPNGVTLEIQNNPCGRKDTYEDESTIIMVADCQVKKRWIEYPVSRRPIDDEIEIFVELGGTGIDFPQFSKQGGVNKNG